MSDRINYSSSRYGIRATGRPRTIFADMVGLREPHGDDVVTQVARLSAAAPLFRCRLSPGAYRNAADDLLQALVGATRVDGTRAMNEPFEAEVVAALDQFGLRARSWQCLSTIRTAEIRT